MSGELSSEDSDNCRERRHMRTRTCEKVTGDLKVVLTFTCNSV